MYKRSKKAKNILYESRMDLIREYENPDAFDLRFAKDQQETNENPAENVYAQVLRAKTNLTLQERLLLIKEKFRLRAEREKSQTKKRKS